MFRGTTARTVVSLLAAVLLALPFFATTSSFAHAHTMRQVAAKAQPGIKPSGKPVRDEIVTIRDSATPAAPPIRCVRATATAAPPAPRRLPRSPSAHCWR